MLPMLRKGLGLARPVIVKLAVRYAEPALLMALEKGVATLKARAQARKPPAGGPK